jgi:hypothetical protein
MDTITKTHGNRAAVFSPCETYRYSLWIGHPLAGTVNFIMLNPSTADEMKNDPTVERCCRFAAQWGHSGVIVTNLFAIRSTDPSVLRGNPEAVGGRENDAAIASHALNSHRVVVAWGNHGAQHHRSAYIMSLLRHIGVRPEALRVTKTGQPQHPLYLPYSCKPERYERSYV